MARDRNDQCSEGFLQLSLARCILQQNSNLALLSLEQGENPHIRCERTGRSLFHLAVSEASPMSEEKIVPFIYILSNAGLDPDVQDHEGHTALHLAIKNGLLELMTALLKCGAECRGDEERLAERHGGLFFGEFVSVLRLLTPGYWQAVKDNNTFRVNKLVKSWCRVNVSRNGQSLIEFAKTTSEDPKLIKHLVDNEASIELAHAVMAGDARRMRVLLCNQSADLETKDLSNRENFFQPFSPLTLYGAALKYGHKHILGMLRSAKDSGKVSDLELYDRKEEREREREGDARLAEVEYRMMVGGQSNSSVCVIV